MDNGRDLLEMVCTGFETPDDEVTEDEPAHNFSERPHIGAAAAPIAHL
jgi:hypothetical protein